MGRTYEDADVVCAFLHFKVYLQRSRAVCRYQVTDVAVVQEQPTLFTCQFIDPYAQRTRFGHIQCEEVVFVVGESVEGCAWNEAMVCEG